MPLVVDLLRPEPRLSVDVVALGQALTFAFATGGSGDFARLLNAAPVDASRFRPDCFVRDLFVSDLVGRCVVLRLGNRDRNFHRAHLTRLLAHPPTSGAVVRYRQDILRELWQRPELRSAVERTWLSISELITRLEASDRGKRYDAIGRRIDILRDVKATLDLIETAFGSAKSGLSRIDQFAKTVRESKGYKDLCDLLDHEGHLATVDLRVKLGQDGRLRSFEIIRSRENAKNPFYLGPLRRFLARLSMLTRGYRMREAELMGRLANQVFDGVHDAVIALLALGLDLEFYLAAIALRERAAGAGLEMSLPEFIAPEEARETGTEFDALFNPLLLLESKPPRPCDLKLGASALVVITGPNSGGKTRLLEAVGLTQLLAQAGMFVPARRARLRFRDGLFVSLIQEVTADQQEGRLGTELLRIRRMFERLDFNSLVILDELCSGTNPSEGEGIFELVVSLLAELEPQALITTHFLEFAARLSKERPVAGLGFLQVELDENNDPTYGFVPGVAPTSLAGRTAERLGVTREALEALVREKKREQRASLPPAPGKPPEDESERLRR
ncbi:MAG TPA: DNA mismatch repair protein [Polyangiaceae bacterium]|nr:DNA mismatch repair protein [Polyangiaceae bacterium]